MLVLRTPRSAKGAVHIALALASALLPFPTAALAELAQSWASTGNSAPNGLAEEKTSNWKRTLLDCRSRRRDQEDWPVSCITVSVPSPVPWSSINHSLLGSRKPIFL